ncbi:MAG: hypothetical protein HYU35_01225 [Parcubacteria group bacterium]|nr:hypothetical protein [Parcubacteria group bacterium]
MVEKTKSIPNNWEPFIGSFFWLCYGATVLVALWVFAVSFGYPEVPGDLVRGYWLIVLLYAGISRGSQLTRKKHRFRKGERWVLFWFGWFFFLYAVDFFWYAATGKGVTISKHLRPTLELITLIFAAGVLAKELKRLKNFSFFGRLFQSKDEEGSSPAPQKDEEKERPQQ